jgi:hypothetical protein
MRKRALIIARGMKTGDTVVRNLNIIRTNRRRSSEAVKLQKYSKCTVRMTLRIKPEKGMQVRASADISFGTFQNGRSNTGATLTIGAQNAPVLVKSMKQKLVANGCTTTELMVLSTA